MQDITWSYYRSLKQIGIPVPPSYQLQIRRGQLIEFATDLGSKTLARILAHASAKQGYELIKILVNTTLPILNQRKSVIGFDADGENFLVVEKGRKKEIVFIDFSPARIQYKGKFLVNFPQPKRAEEIKKGWMRYYSSWGILRRMRIHILNANPALNDSFLTALKEVLPKPLFKKLMLEFNSLPDIRVKSMLASAQYKKAQKLVENTNDADALREIAVQIYWLVKKQRVPKKVYDLSRMHSYFKKTEQKKRFLSFRQNIIKVLP